MVKIINFFIISLLVNSCAFVGTAGSLVGSASTSTRGFSGTVEDTYLMSKIVSKITLMKLSNFSNITVSVVNGKVLLAGNIQNQEKRLELIKRVWWIDGVKEVYNELEIGPQISFSEKINKSCLLSSIIIGKNKSLFLIGIVGKILFFSKKLNTLFLLNDTPKFTL